MKILCIYGCGGQGLDLADLAIKQNKWDEIIFIDDNFKNNNIAGFKVYKLEEILSNYSYEQIECIISIGEPFTRELIHKKLTEKNLNITSIICFYSYKANNTSIATGSIIHYGVVASNNISIGKSGFINKNTVIGHDVKIGDYCFIAPSVTIGGFVNIGNNCFVGSGAIIRNGIKIGENSIIGMGSVVIKDVEPNSVVAGNPAKFLRVNKDRKVFKKI